MISKLWIFALLAIGLNLNSQGQYEGFSARDSSVIEAYKNQILGDYFEADDSLAYQELMEMMERGHLYLGYEQAAYPPDSSFVLYVIEEVGCGAYCNSQWWAWLHYERNGVSIKKSMDLGSIVSIQVLCDGKYLIISETSHRPASVLTTYCQDASSLEFLDNDSVLINSAFTDDYGFGFCEDYGVESQVAPFISYDASSQRLNFHYGNNSAYSYGLDIDSIYSGYFEYLNGIFELKEEKLQVIDRTTPETEDGFLISASKEELLNRWVAEYELLDSVSGNLNRDEHPDFIMIYKHREEHKTGPDYYRPVLLYCSDSEGQYHLKAQNKQAVLCYDCGGVMGDPYVDVVVSGGYFTLEHYGGSAWRWSRYITFGYDEESQNWHLHKDGGRSYHTSNPDDYEENILSKKDFGIIPFKEFKYSENYTND